MIDGASLNPRLLLGGGINQNDRIQGRFILSGGHNVVSNTGSGSINDNSGNQANLNINQSPITRAPIVVWYTTPVSTISTLGTTTPGTTNPTTITSTSTTTPQSTTPHSTTLGTTPDTTNPTPTTSTAYSTTATPQSTSTP